MQITILVERRDSVIKFATILVLAAAFVNLPLVSDVYQPARAILVSIAVALAALATSCHTRDEPVGRVALPAVLLFALALASAFVNGPASALWGVHGRFQGLLTLALMLVVGVVGAMSFRGSMRFVAKAAAVAVVLQAIVIGYQVLGGYTPDGTMGNRVLTGSWLAVLVSLCAAAAFVERGPWRNWLIVAAASGAVAMGVVSSRGAWFGLIVAVVVLVAVVRPSVRRAAPVVALVLLLGLGAVASDTEALSKLNPASLASGSAASRLQIWRGTAAMVADNPVLGVGPGRYLYEFPMYQPTAHAIAEVADVRPDQAHSQFLQVIAESGIPAGLMSLLLISMVGSMGYRSARGRDAASLMALVGFAAFVGQGVFGIATVETSALGWLFGGVLVGRSLIARGDTDSNSERDSAEPGVSRLALFSAITAAAVALSAGWYLVADASYATGLDRFQRADFSGAVAAHEEATRMNPYTDVYRVAQADAAAYLGGDAAGVAFDSLLEGLLLEPGSYDLELAQATLVSYTADPSVVAEEYLEAVARYPLGLQVRLKTMVALAQADRSDEARAMAREVLKLYPDEPIAFDVLEGAADAGP